MCPAALLSLDNKTSVHYHIYRLVSKEIAALSAASSGAKAQPSQIQSALREMKWKTGYSLLPEKTHPGTGLGGGGVGEGNLTSHGL